METIDAISIALTIGWAGIVFVLAILFEIERRKLKHKLEALKREDSRYERECFSVSWNQAQSRRKIFSPRGIYSIGINISYFVIAYFIFLVFRDAGYAMFVAFLGIPIFMDNAFSLFTYSMAVRKQPLEKLQDTDKEYMEEALEVLETRPKLYFAIGVIFLIGAQFVPQLFGLLPFIIASYARLPLSLAERVGVVLGIQVVILSIALPTTLLVKYKWTILQVKRLILWIVSRAKFRRE